MISCTSDVICQEAEDSRNRWLAHVHMAVRHAGDDSTRSALSVPPVHVRT